MTTQLSFDLPVRVAFGREDFFVSDANAVAVAMIENPDSWPQHKLVLQGPKHSGKSHLLDIWCQHSRALRWNALFDGLPADGASVGVDNIGSYAENLEAETKLFHLHNHLIATGGQLLMTTTQPINQSNFQLPDLKSRLMGTAVTRIDAPDDALLNAIVVKHFMDRQISVSQSVLAYINRHSERSFDAIGTLVEELDKRSLAERAKITRSMVAQVLDDLG